MRACLLAAVLLASACTVSAPDEDPMSGEDGSDGTMTPAPDPDPDPVPDPDPDPGATDDCPPDDMGTVDTLKNPSATIEHEDPNDESTPAVRLLYGLVDPYSELELGLWEGWGAFADSKAAPGDYSIAGADADPANCGLCIEIRYQKDAAEHRLFATGGAVSIESVDGNLKGSASDLQLEEFDDDDQRVSGGCHGRIDRLVFDAPLEAP